MKTSKAIKQLKALESYTHGREMQLAAEWSKKWQILISTILSAQTRDETTIEISKILYKKYSTLEKLAKAPLKDIKKIIRPINFYKTKSKNIKQTAKIITERFKGNIPKTIDELLALPGVGRKVANVYLVEAFNAPCIGVDTHVGRLSRKLRWSKEKNPHKVEKDLEKLFPKKYWNSINYILVRFGRMYRLRGEDKILKEIRKVLS